MIRSELCRLVPMEVATFNTYQRSGDLPFESTEPSERVDEQGRVWSNFTINHAARLIAALQFQSAGLTWEEGTRILREPWTIAPRQQDVKRDGGYCVARAEFLREGGGEPNFCPHYSIYAGHLGDIFAAVQSFTGHYNKHSTHNPHQRISLAALAMTDLARALRLAVMRANEWGLVGEQALRVDPDAGPEALLAETASSRPTLDPSSGDEDAYSRPQQQSSTCKPSVSRRFKWWDRVRAQVNSSDGIGS